MYKFLSSFFLFSFIFLSAIAQTPACSGIPDAGTTTANVDSICSGVSFNLSIAGATSAVSGLSYQWQSSTDNIIWGNIGTIFDDSLITSQTIAQYYRRIIYCGAASNTSIPKLITLKQIATCYCIPPASICSTGSFIRKVSIDTLNNYSFCSVNGYRDYSTSIAAIPLYTGISTPIGVTTSHSGQMYVAVWIDYNRNSIFETSEYSYIGSGDGITVSSLINVPADATPGFTKMRVRQKYKTNLSNTDACTYFNYGETEDYLINILIPAPCTGTPAGGNTVSAISAACSTDSISLSVTGSTAGFAGLTYQWQSSPDSIVWQDVAGKTNLTCVVYQGSTSFYRRKIRCSGDSSFSLPVKIIIKTLLQCYCKPANSDCSQSDYISKVSIGSFSKTSDCSLGGYIDYTDSIPAATIYRGFNNVAVSVGPGGTQYAAAWIDFNRNGLFDPGEYYYMGSGNGVTLSKQLLIPANAPLGITRIRFRERYNILLDSANSCSAFPNGETEDYLVNIADLTVCTPVGSSVCSSGDVITRLVFGSLDTTTACSPGGYGDFTQGPLSTTVSANSFVPIQVEAGCSANNPGHVGVWIDFNHDGILGRSEFTMVRNDCDSILTHSISIPSNAIAGFAIMRIRATADYWFTPSDACTHFTNGETEDYKILIQPASCPVNTWTGLGGTNNWENAANWSCQQVPGVHSNTVINNATVTVSSDVTVYSLNANANAVITVLSPYHLITTH